MNILKKISLNSGLLRDKHIFKNNVYVLYYTIINSVLELWGDTKGVPFLFKNVLNYLPHLKITF